jgi:hypothetical protein
MNTVTIITIIVIGVAITGLAIYEEFSKTASNEVIRLSVTAETSPNNEKIYTLQELSNMDNETTILDNSTLDKIPVLKNAIDNAFFRFKPPPFHESIPFSTLIRQSDADSITELAGNKVYALPETQINDNNFGVNFTRNISYMEFKFNTLFYHVVIEKLASSQDNQTNNTT